MKLIEMEQDGAALGVVSSPVLINPASIAAVHAAAWAPGRMTTLIFVNGFRMAVVGKVEDIGRQIQEALGPTLEPFVYPFPDRTDVTGADAQKG